MTDTTPTIADDERREGVSAFRGILWALAFASLFWILVAGVALTVVR
jgi:hypothetical protein